MLAFAALNNNVLLDFVILDDLHRSAQIGLPLTELEMRAIVTFDNPRQIYFFSESDFKEGKVSQVDR